MKQADTDHATVHVQRSRIARTAPPFAGHQVGFAAVRWDIPVIYAIDVTLRQGIMNAAEYVRKNRFAHTVRLNAKAQLGNAIVILAIKEQPVMNVPTDVQIMDRVVF